MTKYLSVVPRSTGDPLLRIRTDLGKYSAAHRQVGKVFLDAPDRAIRASVEEIARLADVSAPTVIRFCRALGFDGFSDFKLRLAQSLAAGTPFLHRAINPDEAVPGILHKILFGAAAVLTNLEAKLDAGAIEAAIGKIAAARRIECYGVGATSTFLANNAQARFSRLGLASNAYFDAHLQLISAAALTAGDVVLAISHVGRMPTLLEAVEVAREQGATIIGITQPNTPLAARCTIPITVEVPDDPAVRVGTEAYLAGALLIEVLMVGIGLRLGPLAIDRLQRVHAVLSEHGIDSEVHPALKWGWSKAERGATDHE
ncbi:MAG: SIS domain-containing protein [Burkholderiales bacterium]|nr:SIS domain-containing protein [Burkholderiales bacterium]